MKPTTKKLLIGSAIALFFFLLIRYGINKTNKLLAVFDKMTIRPHRITNVDIPITLNRLKFDLDVKLTNPTYDEFYISGLGIATLKRINVFYNGVYIATANVSLDEISIPENNELVIPNIPVEVPNPIQFIKNNLVLVYSMINNFSQDKITVTGVIEVAGFELLISQ